MKVVFLDTYPIRRGAQVFISELSDVLESKKHETFRIYLYRAEKNASLIPIRAQDVVLDFSPNHLFEKFPSLQPALLWKLAKEIQRISPDVVLLNGSRTLKYGIAVKRLSSVKTKWVSRIIDNAEFWNSGKLTHFYYKRLIIPFLEASVGVSQASLDSMIRHYGFSKPTRVIHRAFDSEKFKNSPNRETARKTLGIARESEVLLFLGNLTAQKRPDRFVEIVINLTKSRPNLIALIVGDGPMREELESKVRSATYQVSRVGYSFVSTCPPLPGLTSPIAFTGYQQDVSPYLAVADLLILTSDTEGLPGVVLEAAHFQVPTAATEVGGINECLIDGETGFLIPDRSIDGFCEKINFLLDHPDIRLQMGEKAQAFVSQYFQMDQVAVQYMDFFSSLICTNPSK